MNKWEIEDAIPLWFIFGVNKESGYVDVSTTEHDIACNIHPDIAKKVIESRNRHIDEIMDIFADTKEALCVEEE